MSQPQKNFQHLATKACTYELAIFAKL